MLINERQYFSIRSYFVNRPAYILQLEQAYMQNLLTIILEAAENIYKDFSENAHELLPFWKNYPPEQRGRQPTGQAIPLLELGEKTLSGHLFRALNLEFTAIRFPGLPIGGDIRFATQDALIHLDIKLTGPNDNPNELVVPPNQISGDGQGWQNGGMVNSAWPVFYQTGQRKGQVNYHFQPKLSPFYILNDQPLLCLTFFLKAVYLVEDFGIQPLEYFELSCIPNGLLLFDNELYGQIEGLIIAGKDDKSKAEDSMRIRVRLDPLAQLQPWRCTKIVRAKGEWQTSWRYSSEL